ncbi:PA14 domain-containing protein [Coleofasciculus sp. FACHB-129]|uniref:PA14 domain-containing protein n=1 Tax=Cyanophyceae TaxID=3028117 RepID=UPI0016889C48|nr:PA14 domain-containing protein [Coleofasciculus sp. FACHB-129]MBD1895739.1 SBBP repeat-containing protein [Coleofasciculus sp. FACHB-129]
MGPFKFFSKKRAAAIGFQPQKSPQKTSLQTFILEPILTPSGLLDGGDSSPDPVVMDWNIDTLPDVDLPDMDVDADAANAITDVDILSSDGNVTDAIADVDLPDADADTNATNTLADVDLPDVDGETDATGTFAATSYEMAISDADIEPVDFFYGDVDDPLAAISDFSPTFESGVFTVGDTGEVSIDFLSDGGQYQGELAVFSLGGMEGFELGSEAFIKEAASRALSNSELGHVALSDATEGARFSGALPHEGNFNTGAYQGVKTFSMRPGDTFGVMLVPHGTVQQLYDNPAAEGYGHPLFSMTTANPNDAFHMGQIADVTGDGNTFVMEDMRVDGWTDKDYNDVIFQVRGATGKAALLDDVINSGKDWRSTDMGEALIAYAKPYITPDAVDDGGAISVDPILDLEGTVDEAGGAITTDSIDGTSDNSIDPLDDGGAIATDPIDHNSNSATNPTDDADVVEEHSHAGEVPVAKTVQPKRFEFVKADQPLVGVIDTGFSANNPDLDYSRIILGQDRVNGDANPLLSAGEGNEHGTHVLGIIGATQDNGVEIDGINDDAPLWVGRAVGSGKWADSLVEFVDAAKESGQPNAVVNLSLDLTQVNPDGSVTTRYEFTPAERAAIEYARQHNVLIVAAAGNDGGVMSVLGQASQEFDNIITVGAAERVNDSVALSKAFGRAAYSSYGNGLDIMAPGGTVENPELSTTGDGMGVMAGTSVASAKVTGAVSQVWAANPGLSYRQVIEILKSTATDLNTPNWNGETGAGLLNLAAAVGIAKVTKPEPYDCEKILIPTTWGGSGQVTPSERAVAEKFWQNGEYYNWVPYQIKIGDTLSAIAQRTMGNAAPDYYGWIVNHNSIANPNYIPAGTSIEVPQWLPNYQQQPQSPSAPASNVKLQWIKQMGTTSDDFSSDIAVDNSGNIYMTGGTAGSLDSASSTGGGTDAFITKYATAGDSSQPTLAWVRQLGTSTRDWSRGVTVDSTGNVYIAGITFGSLDGNINGSGINADWSDPFLTKYDADGNKLWTRQLGSSGFDYNVGVTGDGIGNIYTLGYDDGPGTQSGDSVVTKWDSSGNKLWSRIVGTQDFDWASGIATDSAGNVYIAGQTGYSQTDAFVTKYDSFGNQIWMQHLGTTGQTQARSVATDSAGNIYIAGLTEGSLGGNTTAGGTDVFLTKYDFQGNKLWTRQLGTAADEGSVNKQGVGEFERNVEVAVDRIGNVYLSGITKGSLDANNSTGNNDTFVTQYDPNGNKIWTHQFGTGGDDSVRGVKVDSTGNIYITGTTTGSLGSANAGNSDAWVAKFSPSTSNQDSRINTSSNIYTNPANGHKYFLTTPDTWAGAQDQAIAVGGNLVTIRNAEEQAWLSSTFGSDEHLWIGLTDSEKYGTTEGNFKWVSGQLATYKNWSLGEPNNVLHTPEGEDFGELAGGKWNDLPNDPLILSKDWHLIRGIVEIDPVSAACYEVSQKNQVALGKPVSGATLQSPGVSSQQFEQGLVVNSRYGTFPLYGTIWQKYLNEGGISSWLGVPTSGPKDQGNGFLKQTFENGYIIWNGLNAVAYRQGWGWPIKPVPQLVPSTPVGYDGTSVHQTYINTFNRNGSREVLGFPINNVHPWGNGYTQDFERGSDGKGAIMKSNANDNSYWVGGAIWDAFLKAGAVDNMGYPTSDRINIKGGLANLANGGGVVQNFQGNYKILLSKYGAFPTWGGIGGKYDSLGGANSFLGFPTSSEIGLGDGWIIQNFEGGYILYKEGQPTVVYDTNAIKGLPPDSGHGSTGEWKVQFWDNKNLAGVPKWTRIDPAGELRFAAGSGAPPDTRGIPEDNFSARWETTSDFEGGFYNFISQADDGVRVYIDGVKVVDKWQDQPFARNDAYVVVPKGEHKVVVEYFENGGSAANTLRWEPSGLLKDWTGPFRAVGFDGSAVHSTYVNTYQRNGGISALGYPTNNVHPWENGYTQVFESGSDGRGAIMKSNANDNSYWVSGLIWDTFLEVGGAKDMGYPTTDRIAIKGGLDNLANGGGVVQHFQGNRKIWLSKHGAFPTWGGIGEKYESLGGVNSWLGFPTSREIDQGDGWIIQYFEGGYILYKPGLPTTAYDTKAIENLPPASGHGSTYNWHAQYWNNQQLIGSPVWSQYEATGELRFAVGQGGPVGTRGVQEDHFSGCWITTSYFDGGIYNFINQADDGVRVYVDGQLVIDKWKDSSFETKTAYAAVSPGYHQVMVEYFENGDAAANTLRWEQANPPSEWAGEFFRGKNLDNRDLAGHRGGGKGFLDKDWGTGNEAGVPIGTDDFSDRWTTTRYFDSPGVYELTSQADDGVRVWVDDKLVIDKRHDQAVTTNKVLVPLDKGYHRIRVEHFENGGAAANKLDWEKVAGDYGVRRFGLGTSKAWLEPWVGQYFNNRDLAGAPAVTRLENNNPGRLTGGLNLNWGETSPDSGINQDDFSARLTTHRQMVGGTYTFNLQRDDGVRLYINGEKVIDQWKEQPLATTEATITLPPGLHTLELEYFERGGAAAVNLNWNYSAQGSPYTPATDQGEIVDSAFQAAYNEVVDTFGAGAIGIPITALQPQFVSFGTRGGWSLPAMKLAGHLQEFRGSQGRGAVLQEKLPLTSTLQQPSSPATFVFGKLWEAYKQAGGPAVLGFPLSSQKDLGNGAYELELPKGKLFWAPGMTNPTYYEYLNNSLTIPADSWRGEYFNNRDWAGNPVVVRSDSASGGNLDKDWSLSRPVPGVQADNFSVRWTSQRPFERGTYRFIGNHDDGFKVEVNGQAPIDKMIEVATQTTGYATFTRPSQYGMQVKHREYGGGARAKLHHEKASNYVIGLDPNNNPTHEIIDAFWRYGGYDRVGVPANDVHGWGNGVVQDFDGGANGWGILMKRHGSGTAYYTYGDIWKAYYDRGGAPGWLGYATSDIFDDGHGNTAQEFEGNRITRRPNGETFIGGYIAGHLLPDDFYRVWRDYKNTLGHPTSGVNTHSSGAKYQYFQNGSIVSSQYGTYPLYGGIRSYYMDTTGGLNGPLGAPKSGEYGWNGYIRQDFANGYILWKNGVAVGYKPNGSLLYPPPSSIGGGGGSITTKSEYLKRLYGHSKGTITQHPNSGHLAIDSVNQGAYPYSVYALAGGVIKVKDKDQYGGNYIDIWNEQLQRTFRYIHFENFNPDLRVGQSINAGHYLGIEGYTGYTKPDGPEGRHTHFEARLPNGQKENPWIALGKIPSSSGSSGGEAIGDVEIIGELIETWPDADSVINFMAGEFSNNPKTQEVEAMRFLNDINNPWLILIGAPLAKLIAYSIWADQVRAGGKWDHKKEIKARSDKKEWTIDGTTGRYYQFESWSNSHYGYVGRIAGFSEFELLQGAGLAQTLTNGLSSLVNKVINVVTALIGIKPNLGLLSDFSDVAKQVFSAVYGSNPNANIFDPSSIDDPKDQSAIKDGFRLSSKYPSDVSKAQFINDLRSNESQLHNAYGLP